MMITMFMAIKNMNIATGLRGITNSVSSEQYERLIFLLNNTNLQSKVETASCSRTRGGAEITKPILSQTMAYQATSDDATRIIEELASRRMIGLANGKRIVSS
ncbi:hypothetical protein M9H77_30206 [Catharanthus roseus]|uniref:Uncharacterized protein n=1 Tax=Catharanthus roseus TaxID=4058 RepID=A0ACB9ZWY3_CATRO|nr:hypothetical protein M9H77_30206 [Catharanthus roseus]